MRRQGLIRPKSSYIINMDYKKKSLFERKRFIVLKGTAVILAVSVLVTVLTVFALDFISVSPETSLSPKGGHDSSFTAVADIGLRPFSYTQEGKGFQGYNVELVYYLADKMNMDVSLKLMEPAEAMAALASGEADAFLGFDADTAYAHEGLITTIPTGKKDYAAYGRASIDSFGEFYGTKIASIREFPELGLSHELSYVYSYKEMFEGIRDGKYDLGLCPVESGEFLLKEYGIRGIHEGLDVCHTYECIALREGSENLRNKMNIALRTLHKDGTLKMLDGKWIDAHYQSMKLSSVFTSYPPILGIVIFSILFAAFMGYLHFDEKRNASFNVRLNERLYDNIEAVDERNVKLEAGSAQLSARCEKAVYLNDAKTRFLANLSKEIRNPVDKIVSSTELALGNFEDPDLCEDYLKKIQRTSKNLLVLVNKIMEVSRIESNTLRIDNRPNDIYAILDDVDAVVSDEADRKRLRLYIRSIDVKDSKVFCDRLRLNQAIINLVSNAIKYTERGEVRVTLTQTEKTRKGYGRYVFKVKDTGSGMDPEKLETLYEPFVSGDVQREGRAQPAIGLGLPISRGIIRAMGGTMEVDTAPGKGTEFIISLELRLQNEEPDPRAEALRKKPSEPDLSGRKVLVATSDAESMEEATELLRPYGITAEWAQNAGAALDMTIRSSALPYSLILMDVKLPEGGGYEAAKKIRALSNPSLSMIPIVSMTDSILYDNRREAISSGINAHLSKPIEEEALIELLKSFVY